MKRTLSVIVLLAAICFAAFSQPRAIGARFGYNFEASYQHEVGMKGNFLEIDAGLFPAYGIYTTGVYDFKIADIDGDWVFYGGPGVSLGVGAFNEKHTGINLGVAAQIGGDYTFSSVPLSLSFDWRPAWYFMDGGFIPYGFAFGVRYRF